MTPRTTSAVGRLPGVARSAVMGGGPSRRAVGSTCHRVTGTGSPQRGHASFSARGGAAARGGRAALQKGHRLVPFSMFTCKRVLVIVRNRRSIVQRARKRPLPLHIL